MKRPIVSISIALCLAMAPVCVRAQQRPGAAVPCAVTGPTSTFSIRRGTPSQELNADPRSPMWRAARSAKMTRDCTSTQQYPDLTTEIRGFWTDSNLYFLFICPYRSLNLFLPTAPGAPRRGLWDRDVVEMFLGDDWVNIRHYREFEIAPTGDWIDLAIDLDRPDVDRGWRSGWTPVARIDEAAKVWYAACRIPLRSVSEKPVEPGTKWRANLYRIDGDGPDPRRRFMCWQPTCVTNRDPNHVPEHFGTLVFEK